MKVKKDKIKEYVRAKKDEVIQDIKAWIEIELNDYQEPTRTGTAKGEPIGLSRKKFEAALWMVLFPQVFRLKDIAERVGVSNGVLRVWRTQDDFKRVTEDAAHRWGSVFARTIENVLDHLGDETKPLFPSMEPFKDNLAVVIRKFFSCLPFLPIAVSIPVIKTLKKGMDSGGYVYPLYLLAFHEEFFTWDDQSLKEFERKPVVIEISKLMIETCLDLLSDPEAWKNMKVEDLKEIAEGMKRYIFDKLDILAS